MSRMTTSSSRPGSGKRPDRSSGASSEGSLPLSSVMIPWQEGAAWFWDTLVDADLANNTMGWQWSAGCGADAAPYFRIFNPVIQGEKTAGESGQNRRHQQRKPECAGDLAQQQRRPQPTRKRRGGNKADGNEEIV